MVHIVKIPWDDAIPLAVEEIRTDDDNNFGDVVPSHLQSRVEEQKAVLVETALCRITNDVPGLYAYSFSCLSPSAPIHPNIRATRLAMACGLHSQRFTGDVYIGRRGYCDTKLRNFDLCLSHVQNACIYSPDIRAETLAALLSVDGDNVDASSPEWLENAAQMNYHDGANLAALANAMTRTDTVVDDKEEDCDDESATVSSSCSEDGDEITSSNQEQKALTQIPLCWHCRGPASTLCEGCGAVYFCDPSSRRCQVNAWSHQCLCATWKVYVDHRNDLSSFPYFSGWQITLLQEDCFTSERVYESYLVSLGVLPSQEQNGTPKRNWWTTELHGWCGGCSASAKDVDIFQRVSYVDGFALGVEDWVPQESYLNASDDVGVKFDEHSLPMLNSWEDWYRLRQISSSSPIALLATFPLTLYYCLQHYGNIPITVAKMMERPLRIHVVGIEKELNFVDMFREIGYLIPKESVNVDMYWIVRDDMFPKNSKGEKKLTLQLTSHVKLSIVAGTYGDSLDPDFDFAGPPDMIVGLNAGLYAYSSWRDVIAYLYTHPNVTGVFTDYNEHSGLNCASLGGSKARKSLKMNPFRQPRAMPVYCMNLPQFSNGFIYVFNEQELE
ncbi:hypothetical protein ACHAWC_003608 [Mediolabrus comicus]